MQTVPDAQDRFAAMCLIETADPARFGQLWSELQNDTLLSGEAADKFPKTVAKAYNILCKYKKKPSSNTGDHTRNQV